MLLPLLGGITRQLLGQQHRGRGAMGQQYCVLGLEYMGIERWCNVGVGDADSTQHKTAWFKSQTLSVVLACGALFIPFAVLWP